MEWAKKYPKFWKYQKNKYLLKQLFEEHFQNCMVKYWNIPDTSEMILGGEKVKLDLKEKIIYFNQQRIAPATKNTFGWKKNTHFLSPNHEICNVAISFDYIIQVTTPEGIFFISPSILEKVIEKDWFFMRKNGILKIIALPLPLAQRKLTSINQALTKSLKNFF